MMKKFALSFLIILIFALGVVGIVYYENIKGALPAITGPDEDITKVINTTDMPFTLPDGFSISIYAKDLEAPRVLAWAPSGNFMVSVPSEGKVVELIDKDSDGLAETHVTVVGGLNKPNGLADRCDGDTCKLYIAETNQVAEYDYDKANMKATNKKKLFDLPGGGNHFTRDIVFEPASPGASQGGPAPDENKMLVSIGSSCNVCNEEDDRRAKIMEYDFGTGKLTEFARGLRNSVFMTIHPVTGAIWATEMGRDLLGDDIPPDEINIVKKGGNYGWPICYGKNIHDDNFDKNTYIRNPCMEPFETPSHIDLQAHSAPLGLAFFPEEGWPEEYWHDMLVAYHGSWNRTVPTGYKIVRFKLDDKGNYQGQEDFITGFIKDGEVVGRPVDIAIQPGGTIYISDDKAGVIYKVRKN
jgi:glucose/arabinose dehydrogenase